MPITFSLYDTSTLLGTMEHMEPVPTYFRDLAFTSAVNSTDEYIDFEKVTGGRKLAPFVAPLAQGVPIYNQGSKITRLKPAYIKPKDAVTAARMLKKRPGQLLSNASQTPAQRYDAIVADILREHRNSIERRWEWMAAQALRFAAITIVGEDYPEHVVDFGRDPAHNVVLVGGATWDNPGANPIEDLNSWIARVGQAKFGGPVTRATFGSEAWNVFYKNPEVRKQLDTQVRGTDGNFATGLVTGTNVQYMGRIGFLDFYMNTDYYEVNGVAVPFMDSKEVLLTGPNVRGVQAFGAILDVAAGLQPLSIFPKMWNQQDPSVTFIMSQSAPLFIPVNPNATLRALVLEE